MSKIENRSQKQKRTIHIPRKFIIIGIFLLLIIITIPTAYITTYNKNKIHPFKDVEGATYASISKIDKFDFELYCSSYEEVTKDKPSTTMSFKAKCMNINENYTISNLKFSVCLGSNWNGRLSTASSAASISTTSETYATASISSYKYKYPDYVLGLKIKHPTLYVNVSYDEANKGSGEKKSRNYILTYSYNKYITDATIFD